MKRSYKIAYIAIIAAILTSVKVALAAIPNIEAVSTIIICCSIVLGLYIMLPAVTIFCLVEMIIYPTGAWVVSYFIYWNLLAILSYIIFRKRHNIIAVIAFTIVMTVFYGLLTSFIDIVIAGTVGLDRFFYVYKLYYLRGVSFYAAHIIGNFTIMLVCYSPLIKMLKNFNYNNAK